MTALHVKENLEKYACIESCPVRNVIAHFSGKWPILILSVLSENETTRFGEIRNAVPDISSKVLSDTLKNLESCNLISRRMYAEVPPRVEYSLTETGKSLMPVLSQLIKWAIDNYSNIVGKEPRS